MKKLNTNSKPKMFQNLFHTILNNSINNKAIAGQNHGLEIDLNNNCPFIKKSCQKQSKTVNMVKSGSNQSKLVKTVNDGQKGSIR